MLLAMSAANAALLTDHFLGRYAALEVVALCVGIVPLVTAQGKAASRLAWQVYFPLRIGDLGMLVAVLIIGHEAGTLHIDQALRAATGFETTYLTWILAGLTVAAWAKLGGWPFGVWGLAARQLSLASHAWLYATLLPNLGAYLLYRIAPLLALAPPLSTALAWLGASGAALGALAAFIRRDVRTSLVSVGAAQAGLALCAASAGLQPVLLLGVLALTPLRLLLYLAADVAQLAASSPWRRVGVGLFALGSVALSAFSLLTTWWIRRASALNAGLPVATIYVAEIAVALGVVWAASATRSLVMPGSQGGSADRELAHTGWRRGTAAVLLSVIVLAGGLAFRPLSDRMAAACGLVLLPLPSALDLVRYALQNSGLLATAVIGLTAWLVRWHLDGQAPMRRVEGALRAKLRAGRTEDLFAMIGRAVARGVRVIGAVEHQGLDGLAQYAARAVTASARVAHRWVEQEGLDSLVPRVARAVTRGSRIAHRWVEQDGLEEMLRAAARTVLRASRALQRQHTGRLRRNIVWMAIALALSVVCLSLWRW
jgi:formate hydrogenlyase subunit 3/multisubunit Na+/H+ antiporter MnhD subunit